MKRISRNEYLNPFLIFAEPFQFHKSVSPQRYCYVSSIYLIEKGNGCLHIDDQTVQIHSKSLVYIPSQTIHTWQSDRSQPLTFRCAYFDWKYVDRPHVKHRSDLFIMNPVESVQFSEELISPALDLDIPRILNLGNFLFWQQLFLSFSNHYDVLHLYSQEHSLEIQARFNLFLKHFLEMSNRKDRYIDPRIKEVITYMENEDRLEYEYIYEIVEKVGLSRSYFQTLFKNQVNVTPKQYWNQIRIQKVKGDLKNSLLTITEISDKHHYSTVHYFSKAFKDFTGETPSAFRQKNLII